MIFQTEKQLKEYGEKVSEEKRKPIEEALNELKEAEGTKDLTKIEPALEKLNAAWTAASEELYKAMQDAQQGSGDAQNPFEGNTTNTADAPTQDGGGEVTDAEFEEVK